MMSSASPVIMREGTERLFIGKRSRARHPSTSAMPRLRKPRIAGKSALAVRYLSRHQGRSRTTAQPWPGTRDSRPWCHERLSIKATSADRRARTDSPANLLGCDGVALCS
jgi:hypothetical protein